VSVTVYCVNDKTVESDLAIHLSLKIIDLRHLVTAHYTTLAAPLDAVAARLKGIVLRDIEDRNKQEHFVAVIDIAVEVSCGFDSRSLFRL